MHRRVSSKGATDPLLLGARTSYFCFHVSSELLKTGASKKIQVKRISLRLVSRIRFFLGLPVNVKFCLLEAGRSNPVAQYLSSFSSRKYICQKFAWYLRLWLFSAVKSCPKITKHLYGSIRLVWQLTLKFQNIVLIFILFIRQFRADAWINLNSVLN